MCPRTKIQFEKIRQNRKESIINSALNLFAENGYQNVSISSVAKAAGVSKGLIYNYFDNKEHLLKMIIVEGMRQMMLPLEATKKKPVTRNSVVNLIETNFEMMKTDMHYWKLYISVISQPKVMSLVKEEVMAVLEPYFSLISTYYLQTGVKNPMAYTFLIGSLMDGIALDYVMLPEVYPLDDVKELIIEKLL